MKLAIIVAAPLLLTRVAHAELPMGLACQKSIKIVAAEVGEVGTYEVQIGMKKEKHTALLKRKAVKPVDGCSFPDLAVGQTVVVRYTGPDSLETQVQCIDLAHDNVEVTFPKSIYTVRRSDIDLWKLMPYCPDGKSPDKVACSKKNTQSERGTEYREKVLAGNSKQPQHIVDLVFDPPFRNSVPAGAHLFCALVDRDGKVVIAGSAHYPATPSE